MFLSSTCICQEHGTLLPQTAATVVFVAVRLFFLPALALSSTRPCAESSSDFRDPVSRCVFMTVTSCWRPVLYSGRLSLE
ncbi:hypothetical protein L210DRAFT_3024726 [Boletus edulis BED1]|uniref:Uncharacterized protein n=1 Tax=Boletus edulis BED1 TaxID=1328754 RepID=A0AAD4G440_BOLED|nr:hypothetical protein L210DRAFT_3024726 [Boletus edulis BED1]